MSCQFAGKANLPIHVGSSSILVHFLVVECMDKAILEMHFLRQTKAKRNFSSFQLELHRDASRKPVAAGQEHMREVSLVMFWVM